MVTDGGCTARLMVNGHVFNVVWGLGSYAHIKSGTYELSVPAPGIIA